MAMAIVCFFLLIGSVSGLSMGIKADFTCDEVGALDEDCNSGGSKVLLENKQVYLGFIEIIGDGTPEGSDVVVHAKKNVVVEIDEPCFVDFYVDYTIVCEGENDYGTGKLQLQLFKTYFAFVNNSNTFSSNQLRIEDVYVESGDIFTYKLKGLYVSIFPNCFSLIDHDNDFGAVPYVVSFENNEKGSVNECYLKEEVFKIENGSILWFLENYIMKIFD